MSDIVSKWLTESLGIVIEVYSTTFVRLVQNGYLVAAILRHYNVISTDQVTTLTASGDSATAIDKIVVWLKIVNIHIDDETKKALQNGKISTALELLYKLYLVFQDKDPLHFTTKQIKTEKLRDGNSKFKVTPIVEIPPDPSAIPPHLLSGALGQYKHFIDWHKDKYRNLLERSEETRKNYADFIERRMKMEQEMIIPTCLPKKHSFSIPKDEDEQSLCETYSELVAQEKRAQDLKPIQPDPNVTKRMVRLIKKKFEKERKEETFQRQMETITMSQFWAKLFEEQEKKMDAEISQKILKQSYYEKQMATKVFEIREQKDVMTENRLAVLQEIQKQKDDDLVKEMFSKEKDTTDERCRYYFERDRALELHRRIYEEKLLLEAQRKQDMCEQILEDMLDITFRVAEYKEAYDTEAPHRMLTDLAGLFISGQPIFPLVENSEVIIEFEPEDDAEEEIYFEEIERQNAMDVKNFEDYCNFEWPWELQVNLPHYVEDNSLNEIEMAMNILGHIVFRLLLTKYPKPPLKPTPNIPKVHMAVGLNNLTDFTVLPILSNLLSERQVKIILMEDAINFCLAAYKDEITVEWPETQFVDETQQAVKKASEKKKGKKKGKKEKKELKKKGQKGKSKKKKSQLGDHDSFIVPLVQDKQIQTPRLYPCEEPVLSSAGKLGQLGFEILNLGEALNERLLADMFVEYLKTLKDLDGWVVINYPTTLKQMKYLEEALTSKPVCTCWFKENFKTDECKNADGRGKESVALSTDQATSVSLIEKANAAGDHNDNDEEIPITTNDAIEAIADLDYRVLEKNDENEDTNAKFRVSRLLTNPDTPPAVEEYDTYLTAFINLIPSIPNDTTTNLALAEPVDDLNKFYQIQGCLYTLYYNVYDLATIKHIGKLIVGDYTVPPKTSVQIFGDTVLYLENDMNQGASAAKNVSKSKSGGKKKEKKKKATGPKAGEGDGPAKSSKKSKDKSSKKSKGSKKSKDSKGSKKSKGDKKKKKKGGKGDADVVIERLDKETQIPEVDLEIDEIVSLQLPIPLPGQLQWKYSDLPIPDFFQIALATLWENVEEIYVMDFRELFFRRRVLWKTVMPYLDFVRQYMHDYIARTDDKQIHLYNFQRLYNEIERDMRVDEEIKAELHCRTYEFREKLWEICDNRMREAEEERQYIIMQDWVTKQTCELTNVFITAMQLELDRCGDTLQLLNDYYVGMITKMPCQDEVFEKNLLNYIIFNDNFEFETLKEYSNFVEKIMIETEPFEDILPTSPYHVIIHENCRTAIAGAEGYRDKSLKVVSGMENYFLPKGKKNKPAKDPKAKGKLKLPKFTTPDPEVKDAGLRLIDEWRCAVNGEFTRVSLRLDLLTAISSEELRDMLLTSGRILHGLYQDIKDRYDREMNSVEECCDVIFRAIEEEMAIQPEMILKDDKFYINPNVLLFTDPLPEAEPELQESQKPGVFTMQQLSVLVDILFNLAPTGIMPERAFTFLLQDMIVNNAEDGKPPMMPDLWNQISPGNMNKLSYEFLGHVAMADWKDFVISNLCVDFPDEEQLMDTRRQLRQFDVDSKEYVYDYQLKTVHFWFEDQFDLDDPSEALRLQRMKDVLFKMYRINEETVNYTALLLAFCKDEEPHLGIAKALQLSLGKFVCADQQIGENFLEILRAKRFEELQEELSKQAKEAEDLEMAISLVDEIIDSTVHQCDSCFLESYESTSVKGEEEVEYMDPEMTYLEYMMKGYDTGDEQEYEGYGFLQEDFSNLEIGFEPELYPSKIYYLTFDVFVTVMMAAMPWQAVAKNPTETSFRERLENIYENCRNSEFPDIVLMHEFLNSEALKQFLECCYRFTVRKPSEIINKLLEDL